MPNTREKLIELICSTEYGNGSLIGNNFQKGFIEKIADHLIAHGVTVQKHGWFNVYHGAMYPYSCSECGNCHARRVNFCERCGTKLDLPEPPKGE